MNSIVETLTERWWLLALRGVAAVLFGVVARVWPGLTAATLVLLVGAYALVDGVISLASAFGQRKQGDSPWPFVVRGMLGIAAGIVILVWPAISALTLMYLIAAWAIVTGVFELVAAIELRKAIANEWLLAFAGLGSLVFGVLTAIYPGAGAVALVWTIGLYAMVFGFILIALGFRLHGSGRRLTSATA